MWDYTYDGRGNLLTVSGRYKPTSNSAWRDYVVSNAYDHKNRRLFKSFVDCGADDDCDATSDNKEAQWFFYYDSWTCNDCRDFAKKHGTLSRRACGKYIGGGSEPPGGRFDRDGDVPNEDVPPVRGGSARVQSRAYDIERVRR